MKFDLTFAVSMLLGLFGVATMWMATGHNPRQRRFAPIVGLVAQLAWGWYAWLLGPKAGGLWILVALYAGVYLRGIWVQWNLRAWLWLRLVHERPAHRCADCGAKLTGNELKYYGHWCERCESIAMERMEGLR